MKELNFRALTKENNVMVFGDLINCPNGEHKIIWFDKENDFTETVQSSTICRNSNVKDKDSNFIYEGDIVNFGVGYPNELIIFKGGCFFRKEKNFHIPIFEDEYNLFLKVIGNKFQNPELLNEDFLEFKKFKRKQISELRPFKEGEKLSENVSISNADIENGSPKLGDMIARNPINHNDQWLVAEQYFKDNFEQLVE